MSSFANPLRAKLGPDATKRLVNDHADLLEEHSDAIDRLALLMPDKLIGEDTKFRAIKDAQFVNYIIKAVLSEVVEQA